MVSGDHGVHGVHVTKQQASNQDQDHAIILYPKMEAPHALEKLLKQQIVNVSEYFFLN